MGDKCTFGTRMPIDIHKLNDIIYREVKYFRNYKFYRPNFGSLPLTGKFYAYHDQHLAETEEETEKINNYQQKVSLKQALGSRNKYPAPVVESHEYGWYCKPLVPMEKADRRLNHHRRESSQTKIEVIILTSNPKNRK